jgi:hypothetical protein
MAWLELFHLSLYLQHMDFRYRLPSCATLRYHDNLVSLTITAPHPSISRSIHHDPPIHTLA